MRAWAAGWLVPSLFFVAATPAAAEPGIAWRCVQQFDAYYHVRCSPLRDGMQGADAAAAVDSAGPPLELLPVAQRGPAEVYSTDAWLVPLHTQPSDPALVAQLLQSVLCGKHPACTVSYGDIAPRLARR